MLYGIVDLSYVDESEAVEVAEELLEGGVSYLQLRAKEWAPEDLSELAAELLVSCRNRGVPFIVNDHVELAAEIRANGVHLGQEDGCLKEARGNLQEGAIIGRSTHSLEQARQAMADGADYIGFGPLYPTPTKEGRPAIGLDDIRAVMKEVGQSIPVFCIGGIKLENLSQVMEAGADHVVIVSGLLELDNIAAETEAVVRELEEGV